MAVVRCTLILCASILLGCDEMFPEKDIEDEQKELVTPEEKKALEQLGDRLLEGKIMGSVGNTQFIE
ncbi:MAG: hypothetical protein ABGY95_10845 [Rubritalea sp.]|uniref:hypothetical protein n=1 Tax=Rubritalea sp. TaxID=2109375 RepID=UPI003242237C